MTPLAPGSISLRLYPHDLRAADIVGELRAQALLAEQVGFDGVMTSEHHGGFPNYLPNPLLAATWALDATDEIWAAPCPMLLPLRPASQVIEDLAWTAQRFPGRLGAGFAAGAMQHDFDLAEVPFDEMVDRFKAALPRVTAALTGGEPEAALADDAAVGALQQSPVPVVSAVASRAAARRAARLGIGLLFDSIIGIERVAELSMVHEQAGGGGSRILIRRAWVGDPPGEAVATQMARYRAAAPAAATAHWASDGGLVAASDPGEVAARLAQQLSDAHCDALNLRVFHAGVDPLEVRRQIERLGDDVLPRLRQGITAAG